MADARDKARPHVKGVMIQHLRAWLQERGSLREVQAKLPAEWSTVLNGDAFTLDWIDLRAMGAIVYAIEQALGERAVIDAMRTTTRTGTVPRIQPIIDGIVRLFGLTPSSLFARMNLMNRATTRGVDTDWAPSGERVGIIVLRFDGPNDPPSPWGLFSTTATKAWVGIMQVVFDVCDVPGTIEFVRAKDRSIELCARW